MNFQKLKDRVFKNSPRYSAGRKIQTCALFSAGVMLFLNVIRITDYIANPSNTGLPLGVTLLLLITFLGLWQLARFGHETISAWLLIVAYAAPTLYCFYSWGADLPAAILMSVLVVVMAGMFLGSKRALLITATLITSIVALSYLQYHQILPVSSDWRSLPHHPADAIAYALIFSVIYLLAWIIIRENRQALTRANEASLALQAEREGLEAIVIERTKAIREIQREQIEQLQVLASIGQLSGGIFHDIVNPLTAVSLNLECLKEERCPQLGETQDYLHQALSATNRIKDLVNSTNSCLRREGREKMFSIRAEILKIKKIMDAKARRQNTLIYIDSGTDIQIRGGQTRFGQVIMNLLNNALEACSHLKDQSESRVYISLGERHKYKEIELSITDTGGGIDKENLNKIFGAFFTTKSSGDKNLGLGLSIVKEIVEIDFHGHITVSSKPGEGSTFTLCLPINL
ncbi:MAG: HAMP domain-containing sensor histidine kinase [bacterium]|nr:HAMP domain-containing sensor histidine kinase [bacterium]